MALFFVHNTISKVIRASGQTLDALGKKLELFPYVEKLQTSTRVAKFGKNIPQIDGAFIASSGTVVGKVELAKGSSIWYGAVLRGDVSSIKIGERSCIGDRTMVHCSGHPKELPTIVGKGVVVGSGAILHGCTLEDDCFIGEGAQVLDGATIGKSAIVMAGSIVSMGKVVPAGQVWGGVPARYQREATEAETAKIQSICAENEELAYLHAEESVKTWQQIEQEKYDYEVSVIRGGKPLKTPEQISKELGEFENHTVPGRIFDSYVSATTAEDPRPDNIPNNSARPNDK